ncbi:putative RNA methyltransferase [Brachybacterium sp. DNPG3]
MGRPLPPALAASLDILRCPACGQALTPADGSLACPARHSFDVARAGYVSLLTGRGAVTSDDDEMARARERFLSAGSYDPLADALAELSAPVLEPADDRAMRPSDAPPSRILDAGCGSGHYLSHVLRRFRDVSGVGFDTSPRSLRFAARAHERAAVWRGDSFAPFPLRDDSVDVLLDVFAPRNPPEFARVLRPGGLLLVARPAADHLAELRAAIPGMVAVDPRKEERLSTALDPLFRTVAVRELRFTMDLSAQSARDLVAMTPSARHVDPDLLAASLEDGLRVSAAMIISAHAPL